MTARIGADDVGFFESPRPQLLREISAIEPEASGVHVLLDKHAGVQSTQRLALGDVGGGIVVALWPAELKPQANYLYRNGRGKAMVIAARARGWDVRPSPHLGFFTSAPSQRLYMAPEVDAEEYSERWEGADARHIGQHSAEEVRQHLWPWLKQRGYASAEDDDVLKQFLSLLGRRPAHLRPAMRFRKRWDLATVGRLGRHELAGTVRTEVNAILQAAGEPKLPASSSP
ncbi:MAG: hypothetical protein M3540_03970 [Actinomycetota bacterium]|nr:hypothetical protein [Actinomycetota bacterium]